MHLNCGAVENSLTVHWTARRFNKSILKEISAEYFLEGLMLRLKLQYLWPPDAKNWLIGKDPDAGKDWRQEEKGMTEGEMVGWHHQLNGREFEWVPRVGDGQGNLACCSPGDSEESDMTEQLNWTETPPLCQALARIVSAALKILFCVRFSYRSWNCSPESLGEIEIHILELEW